MKNKHDRRATRFSLSGSVIYLKLLTSDTPYLSTKKMKRRILSQLILVFITLATTYATEKLVVGNLINNDPNQRPLVEIFGQETESEFPFRPDLEIEREIIQMGPKASHVRNPREYIPGTAFNVSAETVAKIRRLMKELKEEGDINIELIVLHLKKREEIRILTKELENTPDRLAEIESLKNVLKIKTGNATHLLETARQKANDTITKLQKENDELKASTTKVTASEVNKKAILELQTEKKTAEDTLTKLQNDYDELQNKTDKIVGNSSNLNDRISNLETDLKNVVNQLKSYDNNLQHCENKANNYLIERNQQEQQLQAKKNEIQNRIFEMQRQINELNNCCEKKQC